MSADSQNFIVPSRPLRLNAPIKLHWLGAVRLTRLGSGTLILSAFIAAAAFNTGTNLLYIIFSTLMSVAVLSFVYGAINLSGLDLKRKPPGQAYAESWTEMEVELINRKRWLSSYGVGVRERSPGAGWPLPTEFFLSLGPGKASRGRMAVNFPRRGLVSLDPVELVSSFPFGFVEFRIRRSLPAQLLVYPKLVPVGRWFRERGGEIGGQEIQAKGHGVSLFSIRDYTPGDPARSIHWRLSSKGQGLKVREYEREESKRLRLVLDFRVPEHPTDEQDEEFENAVSIAASLAKLLIERDYEVGLRSAAGSLRERSGSPQLARIMKKLALVEMDSFRSKGPPTLGALECAEVWITYPSTEASTGREIRATISSSMGRVRIGSADLYDGPASNDPVELTQA